ncbi:MFS general substrate transporter [Macrolepiota fuliginosa MF-IS2]|uniref:MFS general substrate transporter n=1 Tax=Macrolepiota fuliginosa MF-IS2 TaxID=1400762 RepID=A0A9P5X7K0_9AGAR|nr:MFS general substrate transporter [Macrolepiota fuliginosa MF-IS2]
MASTTEYPSGQGPSSARSSRSSLTFAGPSHSQNSTQTPSSSHPRPHPSSTPTSLASDSRSDLQQGNPPHRWFYGPARSVSRSGSSIQLQTPLEREISRTEQRIQMYGGDCIHDPAPKPKTPSLLSWRRRSDGGGSGSACAAAPRRLSRVGGVSGPSPVVSDGSDPDLRIEETEEGPGLGLVSPSETLDSNLVGWDGPDDPANPQNWSVKYKWFITILCSIMTLNVTFASSAPSVTTSEIRARFGTSKEVSYLVTAMFLIGFVIGPLPWGPGSEIVGRRPIFVITMFAYTVFHLGQTLAPNIQTLLVTRFLCGFFGVAPVTNCGGVIADIWSAEGRGPATSLWTACVFLGPVLGPIIAGFIIQDGISWRWVFWIMMFFAAGCTLITIPLLPETYVPIILLKKVKRLRKEDPVGNKNLYAEHENQDWSFRGVINRTLFRPFIMLAMEPILVLVTIYLSIVYGLLYALFQAFPIIFTVRHGFTISQTGLVFVGVGIGTTLGSFVNYLTTLKYNKLIPKWRGFPPAEERLLGAMIGAPALVVGTFWMGWTGNYSYVPWYVSALSTIVVGFGISLIFMGFLSYLVDTYLMYSASAFSANTICRSAVAAAFPLFTVQMFTNMGIGWACTLIGLVAAVFMPSPFLFYKYGARIREKSRFAPCIDLKIKKELEEEERKEKERAGIQEVKV